MLYLPFSVFISFPDEDEWYMERIRCLLNLMDIECLVAKHVKQAGEELWDKISKMIKASTCVMVLYTHYASASKWVEREIYIARTYKKKFIPIKEEGVQLPTLLRGEEREYILFRRNEPLVMLEEIGHNLYYRRLKTPHVIYFTRRNERTNQRLIVVLEARKAYYMGDYTEELVRTGKVQYSYVELPRYPYTCEQSTWTDMFGLELVRREPKPEELGFELK